MNRRLFLTSGISMVALSRMAKGLEDSPFFKATIPDIVGTSPKLPLRIHERGQRVSSTPACVARFSNGCRYFSLPGIC